MMLREKLWAQLLRLFRFSSFIWRLKGGDEQETKYLRDLDIVDLEEIRATDGPILKNELLYLERRRRDQPAICAANLTGEPASVGQGPEHEECSARLD
jgi:hypothetical protein